MIITRTPFRITLGGGGTDLPAYYSRHGGFVLAAASPPYPPRPGGFVFAAALDKYMFISVNRPVVDDFVRLKYTRSEIVAHRDQVQHDIAREAMRMTGIERG